MFNYTILSLREISPKPAMGVIIELEQVIKDCLDADLFIMNTSNKIINKKPGNNVLIICGLSLSQVVDALKMIDKQLNIFFKVIVYISDAFMEPHLNNKNSIIKIFSSYYKMLGKISHLFVPFEKSVPYYRDNLAIDTHYLPMATDTLRFARINNHRPIDLIGYGRINPKHSKEFSHYFNKNHNGIYVHTDTFDISKINNFESYRDYFWNILSNCKISLAYDPGKVDKHKKFPFSFIAIRWFESLSAGCAVLGFGPESDDMSELFPWENSTIEIPEAPSDALDFIVEFLKDEEKVYKIGNKNCVNSMKINDWRYRIQKMLTTLNLPHPDSLYNELDKLEVKISDTENRWC